MDFSISTFKLTLIRKIEIGVHKLFCSQWGQTKDTVIKCNLSLLNKFL